MTMIPPVRHNHQQYQALTSIITARHSCRAFTAEPVDPAVLALIFDTTRRAPSWCNVQPWQVELTSGEGTRRFAEELSEHTKRHPSNPDFPSPVRYHGAYLSRRRQSGTALYEAVGIRREDIASRTEQAMRNYSFFGAPHVAVLTTDRELGVYGAVDCAFFAATLLMTAQSLGVASIPQAALAMHPDFVRNFFDLGDDRLVVLGVSLGYVNSSHPANTFRTPREPIDAFVREHTR